MINRISIGAIFFLASASIFAGDDFSNFDICKAAISTEMLREVKIMKTLKSSEELPEISYMRSDGDKFRYQCKINQNRIVWRGYFKNPTQKGWGRWRDTDPNDSVLTYKITGDNLILHNSSTGTSINFKKSDFKKP
ncbi:hypothetical protein FSY45_08790 [Comamonas sp. Z1]|uniref:hypothetical protein n=1 Tax=Comamonas sp. Z1 TaxID=2601246 RepID=UPI0011E6F14D|nr:hypothetical protein [Comamonas sp. Z1]TYK76710.1 hypothetical protein FSY45_08790 [Comamonas sp. Z1]